ncbi:MAG TPA: type II CAAX endopeptidase family protein [Actinokineospora sp.]|jgi:membrane protease YdiL (CAAX protease family)|nr:type II CAAX endopeptidase family protein [Actinokineospora sp.]
MHAMSINVDDHRRGARLAIALLATRLALVALVTVATWWLTKGGSGFPPNPMLATLSLIPVNLASLVLVRRMLRAEGHSARGLIGLRRGRLFNDIGWGLLWVAALFAPFMIAVLGTVWLMHGDQTFVAFETLFYEPDETPILSPVGALITGVVAFVTFAPLNAPVEELVFRGYAQSRLSLAWSPGLAIACSSVVFGMQHAFFAPTRAAMLVYVVAFTVWGIGSGIIVHRQRRLAPIIIAHFLVNLMASLPAVVFPILRVTGAV